jgi:pimeloyl-ACP methyl ester carboxylesterase
MNLLCEGRGAPTVVFESGLGTGLVDWRRVQPQVARFTRSCSYDRRGIGFSDAGPMPRDARTVANELHGLIRAAGIAPPYVLVGHSIGGLYVREFLGRYSRETVGLVLVDPSVEGQRAAFAAAAPGSAADSSNAAFLAYYERCLAAARNGTLRTNTALYARCVGARDRRLSARVDAVVRSREEPPSFWETIASELRSIPASEAQVRAVRKPLGRFPLIVLTAGRPPAYETPTATAAVQRAWIRLHRGVAALSSVGVERIVPNSRHYIAYYRPDAVVDAVREVVRAARR